MRTVFDDGAPLIQHLVMGSLGNNILVVGRLAEAIHDGLHSCNPELVSRHRVTAEVSDEDLEWADTYVAFRPPDLPYQGIRWFHTMGAGIDKWVDEPLREILLTRTTSGMDGRIAEYCLARVLAWIQNLDELRAAQDRRLWERLEPRSLTNLTVAVLGTGFMGCAIARAFSRLGARVVGVSRTGAHLRPFSRVTQASSLADVSRDSDVMVLAAPLTDLTRGMVDRTILDRCRGTCIINISRGQLLDEEALVDALDAGRVSHAALDVFAVEPLADNSPLWGHPGVRISPHIAGLTAAEDVVEDFLSCHQALQAGRHPDLAIDLDRGY